MWSVQLINHCRYWWMIYRLSSSQSSVLVNTAAVPSSYHSLMITLRPFRTSLQKQLILLTDLHPSDEFWPRHISDTVRTVRWWWTHTHHSCFYPGQQAANLPVLLAARSAVLDRGQQIGGLFWSAYFPPQRVHLFPPHLLSKNEASMCRPLCGMGEVSSALLCDPQPGSFKTRKQLITAVSPSLHLRTLRWTAGQLQRARTCSVASVSVAVWLC